MMQCAPTVIGSEGARANVTVEAGGAPTQIAEDGLEAVGQALAGIRRPRVVGTVEQRIDEVEGLVQRLRGILGDERLMQRGPQLVRDQGRELLERLVAAHELARLDGQRLVRPHTPKKRGQRLQGCGELEIETAAVEDERSELTEIDLPPRPATEAVGATNSSPSHHSTRAAPEAACALERTRASPESKSGAVARSYASAWSRDGFTGALIVCASADTVCAPLHALAQKSFLRPAESEGGVQESRR
jgi:hypothetical protein